LYFSKDLNFLDCELGNLLFCGENDKTFLPPRAFQKRVKLEPSLKASYKPLGFVALLYAKPHEIGNGGPIM
jgi:hypothetical protein